ncbi:MAG: hypothetical protein ACJASY_002669 [Halioglobus sp.]
MITYRIKVALRDVSAMIWRRLRVQGNTSLADLHYIIQVAMGWDDYYLHHFHIYGEDYSICRPGVTAHAMKGLEGKPAWLLMF